MVCGQRKSVGIWNELANQGRETVDICTSMTVMEKPHTSVAVVTFIPNSSVCPKEKGSNSGAFQSIVPDTGIAGDLEFSIQDRLKSMRMGSCLSLTRM
jgi:hypothetical protein